MATSPLPSPGAGSHSPVTGGSTPPAFSTSALARTVTGTATPAIATGATLPAAAAGTGPIATLTATHTVKVIRSSVVARGQTQDIPVELKKTADKIQDVYGRIISALHEKTGHTIDETSLSVGLKYGRIMYREASVNGQPGVVHTHVIDMSNDTDTLNILRKEALEHLKKEDPSINTSETHSFRHGGYDEFSSTRSFERDHAALAGLPKDLSSAAKQYLSVLLAPKTGEQPADFAARRLEALKRIAYAQRSKHKAVHFLRALVTDQRAKVQAATKASDPNLGKLQGDLERYEKMLTDIEHVDEFALLAGCASFTPRSTDADFETMRDALRAPMTQDTGLEKFGSTVRLRSQKAQATAVAERQSAVLEYISDIGALAHTTGIVEKDRERMYTHAQRHFKGGAPKAPTAEGVFVQAGMLALSMQGVPPQVNPLQENLGMAFASRYMDPGMAKAFAREVGLTPDEKVAIDSQLDAVRGDLQRVDAFNPGRLTNPPALTTLLAVCKAPASLPKPNLTPITPNLTLAGSNPVGGPAAGTGLVAPALPPHQRGGPAALPPPSTLGPVTAMPPVGHTGWGSVPPAREAVRGLRRDPRTAGLYRQPAASGPVSAMPGVPTSGATGGTISSGGGAAVGMPLGAAIAPPDWRDDRAPAALTLPAGHNMWRIEKGSGNTFNLYTKIASDRSEPTGPTRVLSRAEVEDVVRTDGLDAGLREYFTSLLS